MNARQRRRVERIEDRLAKEYRKEFLDLLIDLSDGIKNGTITTDSFLTIVEDTKQLYELSE